MAIANARRGRAALDAAREKQGGGDFRPFVPDIFWKEDKEKKFLLFLTPVEELYQAAYHSFIPVGEGERADGEKFTRYEAFISRKDPMIGEEQDDLEDRLDMLPRERFFGVAVELKPVGEKNGDRFRITGFEVATDTITRNGEDGEEEVTVPLLGLVIQAEANFYGYLNSFDAETAPMHEVPFQVMRRGKDKNTTYDFVPFEGREVDLSPLIENVAGINYLASELDELSDVLETAETFEEASLLIGRTVLEKRIHELIDGERYAELVDPITFIETKNGWGKKKDAKDKKDKKSERPRRDRPTRRAKAEDTPAESEAEPAAEEPSTEDTPSRADRFAALRAKIEANKQ